jgi:hypothetical protein
MEEKVAIQPLEMPQPITAVSQDLHLLGLLPRPIADIEPQFRRSLQDRPLPERPGSQ